MKVKILGTQSPFAKGRHNCPSFLITEGETKILLDCGSGSHRLLNLPEDLTNLTVILTHLHRDHYNDIYNLQYASYVFHNQKRIAKPITIYLPATPEDIALDIMREENSFAEYHILKENMNLKIGDICVSTCKTAHPVETYAIRLSAKGYHDTVYTSDTSFSAKDKIAEFAKDAGILICESSLLEKHGFPEINSHLTAKQAGIIAKEANAELLLLTHFWPEEPPENYEEEARTVFNDAFALKEGWCFEAPREI